MKRNLLIGLVVAALLLGCASLRGLSRSGSGARTARRDLAPTSPVLMSSATDTPAPARTPVPTPTAAGILAQTLIPAATATRAASAPAPSAAPPGCAPLVLAKGPTLRLTGNNTEMKVLWQWPADATFQLRWGSDMTYSLGSSNVTAYDGANHLYAYVIGGLTPGRKYYYQAELGTECASGTFYAPPAADATSVKFVSYGDTRTDGSVHDGLAGQIVALFQGDPAYQTLNLHTGDWVDDDSETAWTSDWFSLQYANIRQEDANIVLTGARGNHERRASFFRRYYPQPWQPGGLYWSFDYGPMHVAVLDQYTAYTAGSAQYNWLVSDLAASTKTWKFVVLHEPGWSAGGGHENNRTVQKVLQPLFRQYGVSMVLGGHNHYYARAVVDGIQHLTVGGGGAPLYSPDPTYPNVVAASESYSSARFAIAGNTLSGEAVDDSAKVIDSFTITR